MSYAFQLPAYAPELNPAEPVWSHLKRSLANLVKHDIDQLAALVKTRLRRMQYQPGLLGGFLAKPGLDLTPFCNPRPSYHQQPGKRASCQTVASVVSCPSSPAANVPEAVPSTDTSSSPLSGP